MQKPGIRGGDGIFPAAGARKNGALMQDEFHIKTPLAGR
jgi:hypothetical protein